MNFFALRFLHYVFAACEYGSFHRAAQALGIQASAVSRRIHDIETRLGFAIFRRGHDGVALTKQGEAWIAEVRPHYDALREKTKFASSAARDNSALHIGVGTSLGRGDIVSLLRGLGKNQAPIKATLADGPCSVHRDGVLRKRLDVAFLWECCSHKGCRSELLWRDRLFVCLPEGHELLTYGQLRWADLRNERLLVPQGKSGPLFDPCLLERISEAPAGPKVEFRDAALVSVLTEVMLGAGVTVTGQAFARSLLPGVAWRPLVGKNSIIAVKAIWLESNVKPLLQRFLGRARNAFGNQEK